ncbi:hypothetical protein [Massilia sp. YMA4]|uniref:hypothetical protein n=1 Tax=Massilia sp. YMA4 TaxID=1593482 RepID=UPI000DD18697|nr:hypothetical protein [Massilia sp. YMA4]AXA90194.1 hypothetical protein DPH57_02835 [Massilia sp. YMA4]
MLSFGCRVSEDPKRIGALLDALKSNLQNDDGDVSRFLLSTHDERHMRRIRGIPTLAQPCGRNVRSRRT